MTKAITEFENFILENVNYEHISKMTFDEYKDLVYDLFGKLNEWRGEGLQKSDVLAFADKHYYDVMDSEADADILFVRRFESVIEELCGYGVGCHFWSDDFQLYMEKWDREFEQDWYKKI